MTRFIGGKPGRRRAPAHQARQVAHGRAL